MKASLKVIQNYSKLSLIHSFGIENAENEKLNKELKHYRALTEDLNHSVEKKQLRVETLEKLEKQLRSKIKQNEGDFLVQHQSSCKLHQIISN